MTLAELLIVALAAYRLAHLLTIEDGPWDVFEKLRRMAGLPAPGNPVNVEQLSVLGGVLNCFWCCSFWTAAIFWAVAQVWMPPVEIFAAAGAVLILARTAQPT